LVAFDCKFSSIINCIVSLSIFKLHENSNHIKLYYIEKFMKIFNCAQSKCNRSEWRLNEECVWESFVSYKAKTSTQSAFVLSVEETEEKKWEELYCWRVKLVKKTKDKISETRWKCDEDEERKTEHFAELNECCKRWSRENYFLTTFILSSSSSVDDDNDEETEFFL
jgi:hypothetical protein